MNTTKLREALLRNPTTLAWGVELQRVLNGEREVSLLRLQSVEAYINKILNRSKDQALARACFLNALRPIVMGWQPNERCSKEYVACMLDLIGAYMALEGATKVLGFLSRWGTFSEEIESSGGYGSESDLNLRALVVLESGFSVAPPEQLLAQSLTFRRYVDVLSECLAERRYGGYVASRLVDLGVIQFGDQKIKELVTADPSAIYELLSLLFSFARKSRLRADLSAFVLLIADSTEKAISVFETVLRIYGARLERSAVGLKVILESQRLVGVPDHRQDVEVHLPVVRSQRLQNARLNAQVSQVPSLLTQETEKAKTDVWFIFEQCLMSGSNWVDQFVSKLKQNGGSLEHDEHDVKIAFPDGDRFGERLTREASLGYVVWYSRSTKAPPKRRIIKDLALTARGN